LAKTLFNVCFEGRKEGKKERKREGESVVDTFLKLEFV